MYYNNKRLLLILLWIVLGSALLLLTVFEILDSGYFGGFGGGLIAVGIMQLIRQIRYRNNETYREKIDTEVIDERNSFIRMKAWNITGIITVFVETAGIIAASFLKQYLIVQILAFSVCLIVAVYWISYLILYRKY